MFNVVDSMVAEFGLDHRKFTAGTKTMTRQTVGLSKTLKTAGTMLTSVQAKARAVYAPLSKVSMLMGGLTGAVIIRNIVKTGASFERMMTVVKGVSGATEKMFSQMSKAARHYGETTEWTATQAAESLKYLSMAGLDANQALAALPSTLDLATAGQLDLGRAADITTNIMTQMQLEVEEMGRVNDALVIVQASYNTTINEAAEAWIYAGTKAQAFGVEVEELAVMIGMLADAGIKSSMSGTTLRQSMIKLLTPSREAKEVLEKYNISIKNAEGGVRKYTEILNDLAGTNIDLIEITELFGARAGNIQIIIDKGTGAIKENVKEMKALEGASERLADLFRKDMIGLWDQLKSAVEGVSLELYTRFRPNLEKLLKDSTKWVRDNRDEIAQWGEKTKDILGKVSSFIKNHPYLIKYGLVGLIFRGKLGLGIAAFGITKTMIDKYLKEPIDKFRIWLESIGWETEKAWGKVYKPPTLETKAILEESKRLAEEMIKQDEKVIESYWKEVEKLGKHMADVANRAANSRRTAIIKGLMDEKEANKVRVKEAKKMADKILAYEFWLLDLKTDVLEDYYSTTEIVNEKMIKNQLEANKTFVDGVKRGIKEMTENLTTWGDVGYGLVNTFSENASDALSNNFFDILHGDFDNLLEDWGSLWDSMLRKFVDVLADMLVEWLITTATMKNIQMGGALGVGGGGGLLGKVGWLGKIGGWLGLGGAGTGYAASLGAGYAAVPGTGGMISGPWTGAGALGTGIPWSTIGTYAGIGALGAIGGGLIGSQFGGYGGTGGALGGGLGSMLGYGVGGPLGGVLGGLGGSLLGGLIGGAFGDSGHKPHVWGGAELRTSSTGRTTGYIDIGTKLRGSGDVREWENQLEESIEQTLTAYTSTMNYALKSYADYTGKRIQTFSKRIDIGGYHTENLLGVTEQIMDRIESGLREYSEAIAKELGFATLEAFETYIMRLEAAGQASTEVIAEAFKASLGTGTFIDFANNLETQIYNAVRNSIIAGLMETQAFKTALQPFFMGLDEAMEKAFFYGGRFNIYTFKREMEDVLAGTPEAIASLKMMYEVANDYLRQVSKLLLGNGDMSSYQHGTSYVPYTGPTLVHEGERIFSASDNQALIAAIANMDKNREPTNVNFHLHGIVTTDNVDKWASDRMEAVKQKTIGTQYQTEKLWSVGIDL